jgi:hypothetical protein
MKDHITIDDLHALWEKTRVEPEIVRGALTRVSPAWKLVEKPPEGEDGCHAFVRGSIQVLFSVSREADGNIWVHVSLCGRTGEKKYYLPSFEDIKRVKHDFIGPDRWAYQVFPSEKQYINRHACVLHLFALLDGSPALPDFTRGIGCI